MANLNRLLLRNKFQVALLILVLFLPVIIESQYYLNLIILVMMWSVLGLSWNLLGGYAGQVSFGHAAFFGVGAYTACLLHVKLGVSLWFGFIAAGVAGAICFTAGSSARAVSGLAKAGASCSGLSIIS